MSVNSPVLIRPAATVLLLRNEPVFQVLMVHRSSKTQFVPGALIFPGGSVDETDRDAAWMAYTVSANGADDNERTLRVAATREIFEEAGILLARQSNREPARPIEQSQTLRQRVESQQISFLDLIRQQDLTIDLADLVLFSRWRTPPVSPKRFDTSFYLAMAPQNQTAVSDGRETVQIEWVAPREALRLADAGERNIVLPTLMNLRSLAVFESAEHAIAASRTKRVSTIEARLEQHPSGPLMVLDPEAGYGRVVATPQGRLIEKGNGP